ncbi:MAG: GNAT family N-acetyltransferase [Alphaproteobacteria bacterium]|nr:GNAT family N-acetyltransferase [Alphaproteobacteria bacterium]
MSAGSHRKEMTARPVIAIHASITEIGADAWDRCFPEALETYAYYQAVETVGIPGFSWRYISVRDGEAVLAVAPVFLTAYRLDTTAQGWVRRLALGLARVAPGLLALRLACLGSPVTEICQVGFAPDVPGETQEALAETVLDGLNRVAAGEGIGLLGVKEIPVNAVPLIAALRRRGWAEMTALPSAELALAHATFDDYLATLSRATRKDMRRKLKSAAALRIERRTVIDDVLPRIKVLYDQTRAGGDFQFEDLPAAYFQAVLTHLPGRASCFLYWYEDELLGFNLLLESHDHMLDKFIGMDQERGRTFNLYFVSWLNNVRYCIEHGCHRYQSGQGGYAVKLRLGSTLVANALYFRHRRAVVNALLRLVSRLVEPDGPAVGKLTA